MNEDFVKALKKEGIKPPKECIHSLQSNFMDSSGVEWHEQGVNYEAIFYKDDLEHIALFNPHGQLIEYRRMVPQGFLPYGIRKFIKNKGEIMNRVLLNRGNEILYEVIYRDKSNTRFALLLTDLGVVKEQKVL